MNGIREWWYHGGWPFISIIAVAFVIAIILNFTIVEYAVLSIMSAILIMVEIINFAFERLCDVIDGNYNSGIKIVKDAMAGAVAIASFGLMFSFVFMVIGKFVRG